MLNKGKHKWPVYKGHYNEDNSVNNKVFITILLCAVGAIGLVSFCVWIIDTL